MDTPRPLALQLYTLRAAAADDLPGTLQAVASAGYLGVELAGLLDHRPADVRRWLADAGLVAASAHTGLEPLDDQRRRLDELAEAGVDTWVVSFAPEERFADGGAIRALADDLRLRAELAAPLGMRTGYHNHWWELTSTVEGRPALLALFDVLDPVVFAEVDIYWVRVGGADPADIIRRLGARAELLHVKDGPATDPEAPMVAVGSGAIDIAGALQAGDHVRWHIVELDRCATDMLTAVRSSAGWLTQHGWSRGRA